MNRAAQFYLASVIAGGVFVFGHAWSRTGELQLGLTFVLTLIIGVVSVLKVPLPGIVSSLSVGFVFKLVALAELSAGEALLASTAGVVAQAYWDAEERPRTHQLAFNISAVWISLALAQLAYRSVQTWIPDGPTPALVVAAAVYFLGNTWIVTCIIAMTEKNGVLAVWRECFFWSFPYYVVGGGLAGMFVLCLHAADWTSALFVLPLVYLIHRAYRLYIDRLEVERDHAKELAALHLRTIEALAVAIEAKDQTTHDHLQRVRIYAQAIGDEVGLPPEQKLALQAASLLHDIGKLAVPEHIICKPGKLTKEEFEKVKIHPAVGADILARVQFPYPVVPIVRSHHEKWDGSGYPDGLKGEEIPIGARILSAVDCLDALASDRQYRRALPLDEAMQVLVKESGKSYDPRIVEILARRYIELETLARRGSAEAPQALVTDMVIERGEAPAAGFEEIAPVWSSIRSAGLEGQVLLEWTRQLGGSLSVEENLQTAADGLRKLVPFDCIAVYLRSNDRLLPAYVDGVDQELFASLDIRVGEGLSGWVAENGKTIINGSAAVESSCAAAPRNFTSLRAALAAPLEGASGVIGVLALYSREGAPFSKEHLRIVVALNSRLGLATENAMKYCEAQRSATNDYLTGLPNARALFGAVDREVTRCHRENGQFALLVCDLDGFKKLNDRWGHLEGNLALKKVADALQNICREYDLVARMGGDEFVLVLPGLTHEAVEQRIAAIKGAVESIGNDLSISIGAVFFPDDGTTSEQLMVEADSRMFDDKRRRLERPEEHAEASLARVR